jgi:hypothetical protein
MEAFELLVAALVLYRHIMYTYSRKPLACVPRSRAYYMRSCTYMYDRRVSRRVIYKVRRRGSPGASARVRADSRAPIR